jgi:hypothetical protein
VSTYNFAGIEKAKTYDFSGIEKSTGEPFNFSGIEKVDGATPADQTATPSLFDRASEFIGRQFTTPPAVNPRIAVSRETAPQMAQLGQETVERTIRGVTTPITEGIPKVAEGINRMGEAVGLSQGAPRARDIGGEAPTRTAELLRGAADVGIGGTEAGLGLIPAVASVNAVVSAIAPHVEEIGNSIGGEKGKLVADKILQYGSALKFGAPVFAGAVLSDITGLLAKEGVDYTRLNEADKNRIIDLAKNISFLGGIVGTGKVGRKINENLSARSEAAINEIPETPQPNAQGGISREMANQDAVAEAAKNATEASRIKTGLQARQLLPPNDFLSDTRREVPIPDPEHPGEFIYARAPYAPGEEGRKFTAPEEGSATAQTVPQTSSTLTQTGVGRSAVVLPLETDKAAVIKGKGVLAGVNQLPEQAKNFDLPALPGETVDIPEWVKRPEAERTALVELAKNNGVDYTGTQKGFKDVPDLETFRDPETGTNFTMQKGETLPKAIERVRAKFAEGEAWKKEQGKVENVDTNKPLTENELASAIEVKEGGSSTFQKGGVDRYGNPPMTEAQKKQIDRAISEGKPIDAISKALDEQLAKAQKQEAILRKEGTGTNAYQNVRRILDKDIPQAKEYLASKSLAPQKTGKGEGTGKTPLRQQYDELLAKRLKGSGFESDMLSPVYRNAGQDAFNELKKITGRKDITFFDLDKPTTPPSTNKTGGEKVPEQGESGRYGNMRIPTQNKSAISAKESEFQRLIAERDTKIAEEKRIRKEGMSGKDPNAITKDEIPKEDVERYQKILDAAGTGIRVVGPDGKNLSIASIRKAIEEWDKDGGDAERSYRAQALISALKQADESGTVEIRPAEGIPHEQVPVDDLLGNLPEGSIGVPKEKAFVKEKLVEGNIKPAAQMEQRAKQNRAAEKKAADEAALSAAVGRRKQLQREIASEKAKPEQIAKAKQELSDVNKQIGKLRPAEDIFNTQEDLLTGEQNKLAPAYLLNDGTVVPAGSNVHTLPPGLKAEQIKDAGFVQNGKFLTGEEAAKRGNGKALLSLGLGAAYPVIDQLPIDDDKKKLLKALSLAGLGISLGMAVNSPKWFLKSAKALGEARQETFTPDQARGLFKEIKSEEMKWTGLDDFLREKSSKGEKVTKAELQDVIARNNVQVEEVEKGEKERQLAIFPDSKKRGYNIVDEKGDVVGVAPTEGEAKSLVTQMKQDRTSDTKFSSYQLPGGENYRELLLTLPEKQKTSLPQAILKITSPDGEVKEMSGTLDDMTAVEKRGQLKSEGYKYELILQGTKTVADWENNFRSSHFDEPNILAHVRFNDRTVDGKKTLFLEEVQSDWAQKGRASTFKGESRFSLVDNPDGTFSIERKGAGTREKFEDRGLAEAELKKLQESENQQAVPDMPFKKDWHELAFRRMVRYSSENGYDAIGWTTGSEQVGRYTESLRKAVDRIEWTKTKDGVHIIGWKDGQNAKKVADTFEQENAVSDAIGKSMADKIKNDPNQSGTIEGNDITISDTGMAGFYDKMLVNYANKFGKKFGASTADARIKTGAGEAAGIQEFIRWKKNKGYGGSATAEWQEKNNPVVKEFFREMPQGEPIHILPITPEMKKTANEKGMPLFSIGAGAGYLAVDQLNTDDDTKKKLKAVFGALALGGIAATLGKMSGTTIKSISQLGEEARGLVESGKLKSNEVAGWIRERVAKGREIPVAEKSQVTALAPKIEQGVALAQTAHDIKYAFNISKENLNIEPAEKSNLDAVVNRLKPILQREKGKPLTNAEVLDDAQTSDLLRRAISRDQTEKVTAAILKTRQAVAAGAQGKDVTRQFIDNIRVLSTYAADAGRRLQKFSIEADPSLANIKQAVIKKLVDLGMKTDDILKASEGVNFDNPMEVAGFYRQFIKPSWKDILDEYRYINLLSSPKTHIVNMFSNILQGGIIAPLTKLYQGGIDYVGTSISGRDRQVYVRSVPVYYKGLLHALPEAFKNATAVLKGEAFTLRPDLETIPAMGEGIEATNATSKIGKIAGTISRGASIGISKFNQKMRPVTTALEAADIYLQTLIKSGEREAISYRNTRQGKTMDPSLIDEEATQRAKEYLFRAELDPTNATGQGKILSWLDKGAAVAYKFRDLPVVGWTVPFIRTPMNILKQGLEYSPAGFATLIGSTQKQLQLAKAMVGSTVFAGAAALVFSNESTWEPPANPSEKKRFYDSGKQPYSVKLGDTWYSYSKLGVLAYPIALASAVKYHTEQSKQAGESNPLQKIESILSSQAKFFADQSYVQGISDLLDAVSKGELYDVDKLITNLPSQLIPLASLQNWVGNLVDPVYRKPKGFVQGLEMKTPFTRQFVPISDEQANRKVLGVPREMVNSFSPVQMSTDATSTLPYEARKTRRSALSRSILRQSLLNP